jgi:hypothetical protein
VELKAKVTELPHNMSSDLMFVQFPKRRIPQFPHPFIVQEQCFPICLFLVALFALRIRFFRLLGGLLYFYFWSELQRTPAGPFFQLFAYVDLSLASVDQSPEISPDFL